MKYAPGIPNKNDNVSHNSPLAEFGLLCVGLAAIFGIIYWILGLLVDLVADRISYEAEAALFNSIINRIDFNVDKTNKEQANVQLLIDELQKCTDLPYPITVHIINSKEANAVALPGGHVGVFTGLLEAVPDKNSLAFVLAHELGHFQNRDHLRGLGRGLVLYSLSALITGGNSSLSGLLAPTSTLTQAQYSQARESLSDEKALDIMHCTYGTISGATDFFEYILSVEDVNDIKLLHFFSSHPETQKRIEALRKYAEEKGYRE